MDKLHCGINCFLYKRLEEENLDISILDKNKLDVNYEAGEVIIKQGTFVEEILMIRSGIVKIVIEDKSIRDTILRFVKGPEFVGISTLGEIKSYPFSVIAITKAEICHIRKEGVNKLLKVNPNLIYAINNWHTNNYQDLYRRLSLYSTRNNIGKLAIAIYHLYQNFNGNDIFNVITRKELSEFSSISLESANKILIQLKNEKIIKLTNRNIEILKIETIQHLCKIG